MMKVKIDDIHVKERLRAQPGDLSVLKESIKQVGLIQPLIINEKNELLCGHRRLLACKELNWDEVFSDFEWDNIRVEITNENADKQAIMGVLNEVFKTIVGMQGRPMSPDEKMIFNKILTETSYLSPLQFANKTLSPINSGGVGGGIGNIS